MQVGKWPMTTKKGFLNITLKKKKTIFWIFIAPSTNVHNVSQPMQPVCFFLFLFEKIGTWTVMYILYQFIGKKIFVWRKKMSIEE